MKLKNTIFNRQTDNTIKKLSSLPPSKFNSMKIFFSMAKLKAEYDQAKRIFDIAELNMAMEYCDKDQNGRPILGPSKEFIFNQRRNDFQTKHEELLEQETELKLDKIIIKASEEEKLFNREEICPKCKEKYHDENHMPLLGSDIAALYGIIEFCE